MHSDILLQGYQAQQDSSKVHMPNTVRAPVQVTSLTARETLLGAF